MIGSAATWLVARGIAPRFAKPLIIGALIATTVVGLSVAKCTYDASVIETHETARRAKNTAVVLTNERTAARADTAIQQRDTARQSQIQGAIVDAIAEHPQETADSVGPATAAVLDELRGTSESAGPFIEPTG